MSRVANNTTRQLAVLSLIILLTTIIVVRFVPSEVRANFDGINPPPPPRIDVDDRVGYPRLRESGLVLVEVWPDPQHITLSAYFLDETDERNALVCGAVKAALDRDAKARYAPSHRVCATIKDAVSLGYMRRRS